MKTFLLLLLCFSIFQIDAAIWRVNNHPHVNADFTTLAAAISGASAGDIIYLEGSSTSYGHGTLEKQLTIIGTGTFLTDNSNTQANTESSKVDGISFYSGSENSIITGLDIIGNVNVRVPNITIRRNKIVSDAFRIIENSGFDVDNLLIEQNYLARTSATSASDAVIRISGTGHTNVVIRNNIIIRDGNANYTCVHFDSSSSSQFILQNNVMKGEITTYYTIHINNILIFGDFVGGTGNIYANNICSSTQYSSGNGNQQNITMTDVFENSSGTVDNNYQLKTGSPALNAGAAGGDCGAFSTDSGAVGFVLSTLPAYPAIYEATVPVAGTTSLSINIKALSH